MTLYDPCAAGQCFDYSCAMYGCKQRRNQHMAIVQPVPPGCICPPTSEQTCLNDRCPRKPWKPYTMTTTTAPKQEASKE